MSINFIEGGVRLMWDRCQSQSQKALECNHQDYQRSYRQGVFKNHQFQPGELGCENDWLSWVHQEGFFQVCCEFEEISQHCQWCQDVRQDNVPVWRFINSQQQIHRTRYGWTRFSLWRRVGWLCCQWCLVVSRSCKFFSFQLQVEFHI